VPSQGVQRSNRLKVQIAQGEKECKECVGEFYKSQAQRRDSARSVKVNFLSPKLRREVQSV
jgi:hypothetical protein